MPLLHWLTRDDDIHAAAQTPYRLLEEVASREGYPGRFLMMVEVLSTIIRRTHEETRLYPLYIYNPVHVFSAGTVLSRF